MSLEDARIVVVGGRGVGSPEGFGIVEELAARAGRRGRRDARLRRRRLGPVRAPDRPDRPDRQARAVPRASASRGRCSTGSGCRPSQAIVVVNRDPDAPIGGGRRPVRRRRPVRGRPRAAWPRSAPGAAADGRADGARGTPMPRSQRSCGSALLVVLDRPVRADPAPDVAAGRADAGLERYQRADRELATGGSRPPSGRSSRELDETRAASRRPARARRARCPRRRTVRATRGRGCAALPAPVGLVGRESAGLAGELDRADPCRRSSWSTGSNAASTRSRGPRPRGPDVAQARRAQPAPRARGVRGSPEIAAEVGGAASRADIVPGAVRSSVPSGAVDGLPDDRARGARRRRVRPPHVVVSSCHTTRDRGGGGPDRPCAARSAAPVTRASSTPATWTSRRPSAAAASARRAAPGSPPTSASRPPAWSSSSATATRQEFDRDKLAVGPGARP